MKALCWEGKHQVAVNAVDDPKIVDPTDMIVKVRASGICGSDLHLYDGYIPTMEKGDILGHEAFGEVKPSEVVSHHIRLEEAPQYYQFFRDKRNECLKAIIRF